MFRAIAHKPVFIFDPNPFNPYGTELSRVIGSVPGTSAFHFTRRGRPYKACGARSLAVFPPAAAGSHSKGHALKYLSGLGFYFFMCLVFRPITIYPWILNRWEALMVRFLQICRIKTVVIVHNPIKERDDVDRIKHLRQIRESASRLVVHVEELRNQLSGNVSIAAHPSYTAWKTCLAGAGSANETSDSVSPQRTRRKALFLGNIRADKGFHLLPELADELHKEDMQLVVGAGIYRADQVCTLVKKPNIQLLGDGNSYLSDEVMYTALQSSDVMIAPYKDVTVSGTVLLALTMGLPVVAFDCAEFRKVLDTAALVPPGSLFDMASVASRTDRDSQSANWATTQDSVARADWNRIFSTL